jgi:hypothetical protein
VGNVLHERFTVGCLPVAWGDHVVEYIYVSSVDTLGARLAIEYLLVIFGLLVLL